MELVLRMPSRQNREQQISNLLNDFALANDNKKLLTG
jgi:hypothetical protein